MKRGEFLKRLGIGLAAVAVAPKVLSDGDKRAKEMFDAPSITKHADEQMKTFGECGNCSVDSCPVGCVSTAMVTCVHES